MPAVRLGLSKDKEMRQKGLRFRRPFCDAAVVYQMTCNLSAVYPGGSCLRQVVICRIIRYTDRRKKRERRYEVSGMRHLRRIVCGILVILTANIPFLQLRGMGVFWLLPLAFCYLGIHAAPSLENRKLPKLRLRICADGCELLIYFLISVSVSVIWLAAAIPSLFHEHRGMWFADLMCVILAEGLVFWNGILRVYFTSAQIGVKWRAIGIICGFIPVVNLIVLLRIIRLALEECRFESEKIWSGKRRGPERLCETKYPILMVHGVFFRDYKYLNYWGRIPGELAVHGAEVFYGNHQSAASVAESGAELAARIHEIRKETGCEKVNIIAHSKGGLDSRFAVSMLGMAPFVASLTTINTPHRGCVFADYLLDKIPRPVKDKTAAAYNAALRKAGDENPDFMAAVTDLTASACAVFNEKVTDMPEVYYQSVGSKLNIASGGRFPLNFSHRLVEYFDGQNDGLVSETSFPWGADYTFLTTDGKRGISHGDVIDLNRENIKDFDVREFYVNLVNGLKKKGF